MPEHRKHTNHYQECKKYAEHRNNDSQHCYTRTENWHNYFDLPFLPVGVLIKAHPPHPGKSVLFRPLRFSRSWMPLRVERAGHATPPRGGSGRLDPATGCDGQKTLPSHTPRAAAYSQCLCSGPAVSLQVLLF